MALHHRHKQRILTTIITLIILFVAMDVFIIFARTLELPTALLYAFTTAIGLTVAYQCYNFRHSHEHITLVNTLTQIFLGSILFAASVVMLFLQAFFNIDIINSYLYLSIAVILLTFLSLKKFDEFLEREVGGRFPMSPVPAPSGNSTMPPLQSAQQQKSAQGKPVHTQNSPASAKPAAAKIETKPDNGQKKKR